MQVRLLEFYCILCMCVRVCGCKSASTLANCVQSRINEGNSNNDNNNSNCNNDDDTNNDNNMLARRIQKQ